LLKPNRKVCHLLNLINPPSLQKTQKSQTLFNPLKLLKSPRITKENLRSLLESSIKVLKGQKTWKMRK